MSDARRASAHGLRQVAYFDCPGGGQVVVDGRVAYIAHMRAPHGTTLVDVSDPAAPRELAALEVPPGTHSHKVRAGNGLMLVNREAQPAHQPPAGALTGLGIFDVSQPSRPREITFWRCGGAGVHRFTFDGRYAYLSPEMDGYLGNIVMILDLIDPTARGRPMVDAGAVERGRRDAIMVRAAAPLPSSDTPRQSSLR